MRRRRLRSCRRSSRSDTSTGARDRLVYLSLRRLTAKAFGTLMSLEPAIALLAGLLLLGQIPAMASAAGVIFVVIAGIGAVRTGARAPAPDR